MDFRMSNAAMATDSSRTAGTSREKSVFQAEVNRETVTQASSPSAKTAAARCWACQS